MYLEIKEKQSEVVTTELTEISHETEPRSFRWWRFKRKRDAERRESQDWFFPTTKKQREKRGDCRHKGSPRWASVGFKPNWWRFVEFWLHRRDLRASSNIILLGPSLYRPTLACTTWSRTKHIYINVSKPKYKQRQQVIATEINQQDIVAREKRL